MKIQLVLLCCIILLATSCATTKVVDIRRAESQAEKFTTVFVFGLVPEPVYRSFLERQLVDYLKDAGVDAHTTFGILPETASISKAAATAVMKTKGCDGVIVVRLISKKEERLILQGKKVWVGGAAVKDSSGDWYSYYKIASGPDFIADKKIAMVETAIFNVETQKLVWSALTKTTENSIPNLIKSYRKAIGSKLKSSELF